MYGFDKNGNRTGLATRVDGEQVSAREWAYDAADRFTTGGYVFDGLGRQLTIPAVDAPVTGGFAAGSGDITVSYFDDDQARTISRGGVTTTIDLDPAGRRLTLTGSGDGGVVKNHYVDSSDNPGWSTSTIGGDTTLTRYESTIGGDLALTITDGVVSVALSNPNGDVVATLPLNGDDAGAGITSWASFDEYGNLTSRAPANTGVNTYGWHGQSQRTLDGSGLILMGVRLYNSATGAFTSRDPIDGGNTTTYAYPQDPINQHDLDGQWRKWAKAAGRWAWRNKTNIALTAATFIPGAGLAVGAVRLVRFGLGVRKVLVAARAGKDSVATYRQAQFAGRIWSRGGRKVTQERWKNQPFTLMRSTKTGNSYRSPTFKTRKVQNGKVSGYHGWHANFESARKTNSHIRIVGGGVRRR